MPGRGTGPSTRSTSGTAPLAFRLLQRVGDPNDAEDVVQETFARAWRALPPFAGERRFYPWLTVIASNLCVDTLRRRSRQTPVESTRLQSPTGDLRDRGRRPPRGRLEDGGPAYGKLSDRHQRVLQLREGNDWSYRGSPSTRASGWPPWRRCSGGPVRP